jgi:hypothetical protein
VIIDPVDFSDKPYKVPNQEENRDFAAFLESKEEELAVKYLLGSEMWEEFKAALDGSDPIDPIWETLRDGGFYDYQDKQYVYKGWVDMIRPAILSEWAPESTFKLTNIGYVENHAPDKAKLIEDQYPFQVKHWNKFVSKVGYNYPYGYSQKNTFYGFMKANEDDYPNWHFRCPKYKNRFDL